MEGLNKSEVVGKDEIWKNAEIYPKDKECYKWFHDCLEDGITYENVLKFSDMAKKIISQVKEGKELTEKDWCVSKSIQVLTPGSNTETHIFPEGRPDLFIDKRKEKEDKKHLSFLESVDGVDRGMSEWITNEDVFKLTKGKDFKYEGVAGLRMHDYGEDTKNTIKKNQKVSDRELLLGLMDGDEKLVDEFIETINPDLTKLFDVAVQHGGYVTRMIGINKNKIEVFFADDYFKFMVNKDTV